MPGKLELMWPMFQVRLQRVVKVCASRVGVVVLTILGVWHGLEVYRFMMWAHLASYCMSFVVHRRIIVGGRFG